MEQWVYMPRIFGGTFYQRKVDELVEIILSLFGCCGTIGIRCNHDSQSNLPWRLVDKAKPLADG